ncbi:MAG TPA: hypothetical protein VMS22_11605 [Candidatus Eisenbacteria bacterium]|nr:hypothetical protein [Candidatus Eisenbacteria bacterium]
MILRATAPVVVLAGYIAVLVWLTWPLGAHLGTHLANTLIVCRTDIPYIAWTLAWQSHALAADPAHYLDANIYWPAPHALLFGDPGLSALPFFAPVFLATGNPALAINVVFLLCLALTATCFHAVVRRWTGSHAAGIVAGAVFLVDPWGVWRFFPWAPSYTVLLGFPLLVYLTSRPNPSWRRALVLVPLIVFQALANLVYLAATVFPPLVVLAVARLARPATRTAGVRLAAALGLALVVMAPIYVAYFAVRSANPALHDQSMWTARPDSPALAGIPVAPIGGIPRIATRVPEDLVRRSAPTWIAVTTLAVVVLGIFARLARRREPGAPGQAWRHAWLWTAMGFAMATPVVTLFGSAPLRLPYFVALEHLVPFVPDTIRDFSRLGIAAMIGLALVAGLAFAEIAAWLVARGRGRLVPIAAALVVVLLAVEYDVPERHRFEIAPAIDGRSTVMEALRAGRGPVLELPVGWQGTQAWPHARAMYRSIFYWRPLLNGYSSYWPTGWPARMQLAMRLPERDALATLRRETGLASLIVDTAYVDAGTRAAWLALATAGGRDGLRLVVRDGDLLLFAVGDAPS